MSDIPAHPRRFDREVDGILLLDKPPGVSSNAALQQARRLFRALKAGHAGSLDPLASGLLPVCFGQATKVCGQLLESDKTYQVVAKLGERTNTADAEGEITERQPVPSLTQAAIAQALSRFLGEQTQVPPMYSALKHEGQRLYELARKGETVERAPRPIRIDRFELVGQGFDPQNGTLSLEVDCSKGAYIRTLVEDLALALKTVGHVTALRRLRVAAFGDAPLQTMAELEATAAGGEQALLERLLPIDHVFSTLPRQVVDSAGEGHLLHGRRTWAEPSPGSPPASGLPAGTKVRVYGPGARFLGLAERQADGALQPLRLFVPAAGL